MIWYYLLIGGSMVLLGSITLAAFYWAASTGQFRNMENNSRVIFDEDEPVGKPTDVVFERKKDKARLKGKTNEHNRR